MLGSQETATPTGADPTSTNDSFTPSPSATPTPFATPTLTTETTATPSSTSEVSTQTTTPGPTATPPTATQTDTPTIPPGTPTPAVDTPTSTPTSTFTPSHTPTSPPSTTPTAVPPTADPRRLYLPLILTEGCPPDGRFASVVVAVDTSPAMGEVVAGGESRLTLVRRGASRLVDGLRLGEDGDEAALVGLGEGATVQPLTASRGALQSALDALALGQGMRLDLALAASREALERGRPGNLPAMILVVGGSVPNEGRNAAIRESATLRRNGTVLFVVNLGSPDEALLKVMAGNPARYLAITDSRLIVTTLAGLSRRVQCAPEAYWGRR